MFNFILCELYLNKFYQHNNYKNNNPTSKWAKYIDRHFTKDKQMANKNMKRYSALTIRGIENNTTTKYQHIFIMFKRKDSINTG